MRHFWFFIILISLCSFTASGQVTNSMLITSTPEDTLVPPDTSLVYDSLTAIIRVKQEAARTYYNEGVVFMREKDWSPALYRFEEALESDADFLPARMNLGHVQLELGKWPEAILSFSRVLKDTADPKAYYGRAKAYLELKKDTEAESDLDTLLTMDSTHAEGWYEKGVFLFMKSDYLKALEAFNKTIAFTHGHSYAWHDKGSVLRMLGKPEEALSSYKVAIELDPGKYFMYSNLGSLQKDMKDYENALLSLDEALHLHDKSASIWNLRGAILIETGNFVKAEEDFTKSIHLDPGSALAYNNRGNARYKQERYTEAIADYTEALNIDPDYGYAYLNRGIVKELIRDEAGACADWQKAARLGVQTAQQYIENQCQINNKEE